MVPLSILARLNYRKECDGNAIADLPEDSPTNGGTVTEKNGDHKHPEKISQQSVCVVLNGIGVTQDKNDNFTSLDNLSYEHEHNHHGKSNGNAF